MIAERRVCLFTCVRGNEFDSHRSVWAARKEDRCGCNLDEFFMFNGTQFVCFILDNEINKEPTVADLAFIQAHPRLPCPKESVVLIAQKDLTDYITVETDRLFDGDNSFSRSYVPCGVSSCTNKVARRLDAVQLGTKCQHFACKFHFIPQNQHEQRDFTELETDIDNEMSRRGDSQPFSFARTAMALFMIYRTDYNNTGLTNVLCDYYDFKCPLCVQYDLKQHGKCCTFEKLDMELRSVKDQILGGNNRKTDDKNSSSTTHVFSRIDSAQLPATEPTTVHSSNLKIGDKVQFLMRNEWRSGVIQGIYDDNTCCVEDRDGRIFDVSYKDVIIVPPCRIATQDHHTQGSGGQYQRGTRVELYDDGQWCAGVVTAVNAKGTKVSVLFDDNATVTDFPICDDLRIISGTAVETTVKAATSAHYEIGDTVEVRIHDGSYIAATVVHYQTHKHLYDVRCIQSDKPPLSLRPLVIPVIPPSKHLSSSTSSVVVGSDIKKPLSPKPTASSSTVGPVTRQQSAQAASKAVEPPRFPTRGDRVEVRYNVNKKWFTASVTYVDKVKNTCDIAFDFAGMTQSKVPMSEIVVLNHSGSNSLFRVGATADMFIKSAREWTLQPGVIIAVNKERGLYNVQFQTVMKNVPLSLLRVIYSGDPRDLPLIQESADSVVGITETLSRVDLNHSSSSSSNSNGSSNSGSAATITTRSAGSYLNNSYSSGPASSKPLRSNYIESTSLVDLSLKPSALTAAPPAVRSDSHLTPALAPPPAAPAVVAAVVATDYKSRSEYDMLPERTRDKLRVITNHVVKDTHYTASEVEALLRKQPLYVLQHTNKLEVIAMLRVRDSENNGSNSAMETVDKVVVDGLHSFGSNSSGSCDTKQLDTDRGSTAPLDDRPHVPAEEPIAEQQLKDVRFSNMKYFTERDMRAVNDTRRTLVNAMGFAVDDVDAVLQTLKYFELTYNTLDIVVEILSQRQHSPPPQAAKSSIPPPLPTTTVSSALSPVATDLSMNGASRAVDSVSEESRLSGAAFSRLAAITQSYIRDCVLSLAGIYRYTESEIIAVVNSLDYETLLGITKYTLLDLMDDRNTTSESAQLARLPIMTAVPRKDSLDSQNSTQFAPPMATETRPPLPQYLVSRCERLTKQLVRDGSARKDEILAIFDDLEGSADGHTQLWEMTAEVLLLLINSKKEEAEKVEREKVTAAVNDAATRAVETVQSVCELESKTTPPLEPQAKPAVASMTSLSRQSSFTEDKHTPCEVDAKVGRDLTKFRLSLSETPSVATDRQLSPRHVNPIHAYVSAASARFNQLDIFCPEFNKTMSCEIRELETFGAFKRRLCDLVGYTSQFRFEQDKEEVFYDSKNFSEGVVLSRVDTGGWSVEISEDMYADPAESVHYSRLGAGDCIEVRRFGVAFISGKYRLDSISASEKYNKELRDKVEQLKQDYTGYRRIRGDGNCYYRSVIFGLLEFIIVTEKRVMLDGVIALFEGITYRDVLVAMRHGDLLKALREARDRKRWQTLEEFNSDLLREETHLDDSLIRACKMLVTNTIISKQDVEYNEMTIRDAITLTYEDISSVEAFCEKYVLAMDVCAEGIHVNLGLLPTALGCNCNIVILPRDRNQRISTVESRCGGQEGDTALERNLCTLHLLLRPGHYDLLYTEDVSGKLPERPSTSERQEEARSRSASSSSDSSEVRRYRDAPSSLGQSVTDGHKPPETSQQSPQSSRPARCAAPELPPQTPSQPARPYTEQLDVAKFSTSNQSSEAPSEAPFTSVEATNKVSAPATADNPRTDIEQLVDCLSVSPLVAGKLLSDYVTVEDSVAHYFGMSEVQQRALEASVQQGWETAQPRGNQKNNSSQIAQVLKLDGSGFGGDDSKQSFAAAFHRDLLSNASAEAEAEAVASVAADRASLSQSEHRSSVVNMDAAAVKLRRKENQDLLAFYQSEPESDLLCDPTFVELFWRIVDGLGVDMGVVISTFDEHYFCNVYGFLVFHRCSQLGVIHKRPSKDSAETFKPEQDLVLVKLINTLVGGGYNREEVLDAIVFDRCLTVEDVLDVVRSLGASKSAADNATTSSDSGSREGSEMTSVYRAYQGASPVPTVPMKKKKLAGRGVIGPAVLLPSIHAARRLGRKQLVEVLQMHNLTKNGYARLSTRELREMLYKFLNTYEAV